MNEKEGDAVEQLIYLLLVSTLLGFSIIFWAFIVPINWVKVNDDINHQRPNTQDKKRYKDLPPPYPNGWYSILESSELKLGEAKSVSALGEELVVFRTNNNNVFVLEAFCPHMGANMGKGGHVIGNTIECPFHHWSFDGIDGQCINIPYSNYVPQSSRVKKVMSREINHNIFIWYHAEADEKPWDIPTVEFVENNKFVLQGRNEFYVKCHIQEIPENGADIAHFLAVHSDNILTDCLRSQIRIFKNLGSHEWKARWNINQVGPKHMANVLLKHCIKLWPNFHIFDINVIAEQIGPSYVNLKLQSETFGNCEILQTVTPIDIMLQKVVHRFYAPKLLAPFIKCLIFGESVMFERDIQMWSHKKFLRQPLLVKEEFAIKHFRNWYSQFYSENSRSYSEALEYFEW